MTPKIHTCETTRAHCFEHAVRASDCTCATCGKPYRTHPWCSNSLDKSTESYCLHVLCDGLHVKL